MPASTRLYRWMSGMCAWGTTQSFPFAFSASSLFLMNPPALRPSLSLYFQCYRHSRPRPPGWMWMCLVSGWKITIIIVEVRRNLLFWSWNWIWKDKWICLLPLLQRQSLSFLPTYWASSDILPTTFSNHVTHSSQSPFNRNHAPRSREPNILTHSIFSTTFETFKGLPLLPHLPFLIITPPIKFC